MNDRQEDRFSMFLVVRGFLDQNSATVSSIPAFLAAQNDFGTQVDAIQSLSLQLHSSAGTTADKTKLRGAMADAAVPVAAAMRALAAVTADNQLAEQADVTRFTLIGGRDTLAADRADQLHAVATQQAANLVDYGISDSHLITLRTAIDAYRAAVRAPQQTIAANAAVRAQMNEAFSAATKTLTGRLDNLAELFRATNPAFYLGYQQSREIIDSGGGSSEPDPTDPGTTDPPVTPAA